jgi:hypothetical protein
VDKWIRLRHVVSIAGAVRDKATSRPINGARVEITEYPEAFGALLAAKAANPAWTRRRERLDRVYSRADGLFCFVDLPAGRYRLNVSAPEMGTRYGVVKVENLEVQTDPGEGRVPVTPADVELPPTRIHGTVTDAVTGQPIPGARVRLLGDTVVVKTGDDGTYDLSQQIAGKPTLHVATPGYKPEARKLELAAGQERVEDLALQSASDGDVRATR